MSDTPLVQDDATRLRSRVLRAESLMVLAFVLAFAGMYGVRRWTERQMAKTFTCPPADTCRDMFIKHYVGDVVCPRDDQRIEVAGSEGFFCRCTRLPQ